MRSESKATRYPGVRRVDDATYVVRVKATDPRTGKTRQVERLVRGVNAQAAARVRVQLADEIRQGAERSTERMRLEDYARSWLASKLPSLKASSQTRYAEVLDLHVLPALGDLFLDAVAPSDVAAFRDAQVHRFAPATANGHLRVLRTMFKDAVAELDLLPRDPTLRMRAVSEAKSEDDPNLLAPDELRRFLEATRSVAGEHQPLFLTLALTGMRFGEAAALKWEDVDEAAGVIRIRRSHWHQKASTTKTGTKRTVPLPAELAEVLSEHWRQLMEKQAPGFAAGWVFPSRSGTLRVPASLVKVRRRILKAAGIEKRVTTHGLRRTFNNLVRQVATGEVVRSMTGHVTERMTEHYSHVATEEKREAVGRVLRLVAATKCGSGVDGAVSGADLAGQSHGALTAPVANSATSFRLLGAGDGT